MSDHVIKFHKCFLSLAYTSNESTAAMHMLYDLAGDQQTSPRFCFCSDILVKPATHDL